MEFLKIPAKGYNTFLHISSRFYWIMKKKLFKKIKKRP